MKKRLLPALIALSVIAMNVLLLASCRPQQIAAAAALPEKAYSASYIAAVDQKMSYAVDKSPARMDPDEAMAARWLAMGKYYQDHNLLTRDDFDYEQAADNMAARWLAMGKYYEDHDLLTRDDFDYEQAADDMAARWIAMGTYYEKQGLLNK